MPVSHFYPAPTNRRYVQVLKELSTKRVGLDKAAFVRTAGELFPVMCQAWDAQWALIEGMLMGMASGGVELARLGPEAVDAFALATICVKVNLAFTTPHSIAFGFTLGCISAVGIASVGRGGGP